MNASLINLLDFIKWEPKLKVYSSTLKWYKYISFSLDFANSFTLKNFELFTEKIWNKRKPNLILAKWYIDFSSILDQIKVIAKRMMAGRDFWKMHLKKNRNKTRNKISPYKNP